MFKKLRKWYFKLYHLFRFLGVFILIFGIQKNVYAEECNVLYKSTGETLLIKSFTREAYYYASLDSTNVSKVNPIENQNYTFFMLNKDNTIFNMNNLGFRQLSVLGKKFYNDTNGYYKESVTTSTNLSSVIAFYFYASSTFNEDYTPYIKIKDKTFYIVEGTEICIPTEKPDLPQENEVYANFLTIYTDRLIYLANGFTSNPYLIAMIGIIFAWVVLELFLKILHLRGGKYK